MDWNTIIGHQKEIAVLKKLVRKQSVAHALLFGGPAGVGKKQVAEVLAQTLLCEAGKEEPCQYCSSCRAFLAKNHPDFLLVEPDGNSVKIDQIRKLQQEAALAPRFGQGRVFLINEADKMTQQAQNSLLKILEEPPESLIFILVAADTGMLLETIFSRCQQFHFSLVPREELTTSLTAQGWLLAEASSAARLSQGSVKAALALLAEDGFSVRQLAEEWLSSLLSLPASGILGHAESLTERLLPTARNEFFYYSKLFMRDAVFKQLCSDEVFDQLAVNRDRTDSRLLTAAWTGQVLEKTIELLSEAESALKKNGNPRIVFEFLALSLRDLWQTE